MFRKTNTQIGKPMNLKQIRIQNFRNLTDVTIHLNDVNLFIGPNNSGKSNVLQAIRLD